MDDRPMTDWEARVARAKREGTWNGPYEEPSPYPPRQRRRRFLLGVALGLAAGVVLGVVLDLVTGSAASAVSGDALLDDLVGSLFPALFVGWSCTRYRRR